MTQRRGVRPGEQRTVGAARGKGAGAPEPRPAPGNPDGENGQAAREAVLAVMPAAALATGAGAQGGFGLVEELEHALVLAGAGVLGLEALEAGDQRLPLGCGGGGSGGASGVANGPSSSFWMCWRRSWA